MTDDLDALWADMDAEPAVPGAGHIARRLPIPGYAVYLTQARPQRQRGLRIEIKEAPGSLWKDLRSSRGLDVRVDARPGNPPSLQLTEVDQRFHEVFVALTTDLTRGLSLLSEAPAEQRPLAMDFLVARISSWQACLKANNDGLSDEKRAGLFGELHTLLRLIDAGAPAHDAVDKWTGPQNAIQDFQFHALTLEVKASRQTQPTNVRISSERQLDTSTLDRLLLVHYGLDERSDGSGQTLPEIVEQARTAAAAQGHTSLLLDQRLIDYGYLDLHAGRYNDRSYAIRTIDHFDVVDPMPRLVEASLPKGVGRVSYELALSACEPFRLDGDTVQAVFAGLAR